MSPTNLSPKTNAKARATKKKADVVSWYRDGIYVRLRRSFWHDRDGAYQRTSLRYLKRRMKGFNIFDDDCSAVGADKVIPKIVNLAGCKDGIYHLMVCNGHPDFETGIIEDWDYQLLPVPAAVLSTS